MSFKIQALLFIFPASSSDPVVCLLHPPQLQTPCLNTTEFQVERKLSFPEPLSFQEEKTFPETLRRLSLISHWPEPGYMLISRPITSKENGLP